MRYRILLGLIQVILDSITYAEISSMDEEDIDMLYDLQQCLITVKEHFKEKYNL